MQKLKVDNRNKRRLDLMIHHDELKIARISTVSTEEFSSFCNYDSLTYILKGDIKYYNHHEEFTANQGDLFFTSRYADYTIKRNLDKASGCFESILIKLDNNFAIDLQDNDTRPKLNFKLHSERIIESIIRINKQFQDQKCFIPHEIPVICKNIQELIKEKAINQLSALIKHRTDPFLIHLYNQITEKDNLHEMASKIGMSQSTFQRHFKKHFNTSPYNWIRNQRLNNTRIQMQLTQKIISDLYLDLGYEDLAHVSKEFKRKYGFTPKETYNSVYINFLKA